MFAGGKRTAVCRTARCLAGRALLRQRCVIAPVRRFAATAEKAAEPAKGWWKSPNFWGACGAAAGWGMSGSAIYDAQFQGPEVISLTMTPVMIVYSSLFGWWALAIQPRNLALAACHVTNVVAQSNQLRRAIEHKLETGEGEAVRALAVKAGTAAAAVAALVGSSGRLKSALSGGPLASLVEAPAGPFTVHFWAPMSKWLISGASFLDLYRPTDRISLPQYSALTLTGFFFTRYALLVRPPNLLLCSVNIALFGSSAWHLGRKINADYIATDDSGTRSTS